MQRQVYHSNPAAGSDVFNEDRVSLTSAGWLPAPLRHGRRSGFD